MLTLLYRFLPVWLPLLLYALWRVRVRKKAKRSNEELPPFFTKNGWWVALFSLIAGVAMFIFMGLSHKPLDGTYTPARLQDGKLVPAHVE